MDGGDPSGGSAGLARLIDRYGEQLVADFQSEYGLNLASVLRPGSGYSPKHVLSLIRQLPPESRTLAELRGGEQFRGWGADRYLTASLLDAIRENTYAVIAANSDKGRKPKPPKPVPRPSQQQSNGKSSNPFAVMAAQRIKAVREARGG